MTKNDGKLIIEGGWNKDVLGGKKSEKLTIEGGDDYSGSRVFEVIIQCVFIILFSEYKH